MRRCKDIQGGGLILAVCLFAGVALADVWPSWLSPAQGSYDRGNQSLSGAVERLTVSVGPQAWTNYITTNIWASYFSQASKLKASKAMFKAAVDTGIWRRPATNWTPETAETVTASNLLAWCGAPSGWWTNHPYVNIAAVSNGWRFLPDVASNLHLIASVIDGIAPDIDEDGSKSGESAVDFYAAYGAAAGGYIGGNWFGYSRYIYCITNYDYGLNYEYYSLNSKTNSTLIGSSDPYGAAVYTNQHPYLFTSKVYAKASAVIDPVIGGIGEFYSFGDNVSTNEFIQYTSTCITNGGLLYFDVGPLNSLYPLYQYQEHNVGYQIFTIHLLQDFTSTTNGFRWFR